LPKPTLGALLLLLTVFAGCKPRSGTTAAEFKSIRLSQRNEPADLDPALAALPDDFFIIRALSEGLVLPAMSAADGPSPGIAENWETSADGLTWTFHLNPRELWSNGQPLTAQDVLASFRRVLTPATAAPRADLFYPVLHAREFASGQLKDFSAVGFAAPEPHTLVVRLVRANPFFLNYVASGTWIPVNSGAVAQWQRSWTLPGRYVGNGPYVLTEWIPHRQIVVRRNPRYRHATAVRLDELRFIRFDDGNTEERAYRAGEVDVTMAVPADRIAVYQRERPAEIHRAPLAETRYLAFNTSRPPLNNPLVRRALTLALDRASLTESVVRAGQQPAFRLLPPGLRSADDTVSRLGLGQQEHFGPDQIAAARSALAAAGYPGGKGFPNLEVTGWSPTIPILDAIQAMWRENLGIRVQILYREARVHLAAIRAGRYDIGVIALIPSVEDPRLALEEFTTGQPTNYSHWSDPAYDRLVAAAEAATSAEERVSRLLAAESRLMEAAPVAPLYYNAKNWLMRPEVKGWEENPLWVRDYRGLGLDRRPPSP
jgi:oligopeptide transport system substrate-binding protein